MKLLELDDTHRSYLIMRRGIGLDGDGNEALKGLSWSESVSYLKLASGTLRNELPDDLSALTEFLSMHQRHIDAVPESPWLLDVLFSFDKFHSVGEKVR